MAAGSTQRAPLPFTPRLTQPRLSEKPTGSEVYCPWVWYPTQTMRDFACSLIADGFTGILIRSDAKGALASGCSIVLWAWISDGYIIDVVDDQVYLTGF